MSEYVGLQEKTAAVSKQLSKMTPEEMQLLAEHIDQLGKSGYALGALAILNARLVAFSMIFATFPFGGMEKKLRNMMREGDLSRNGQIDGWSQLRMVEEARKFVKIIEELAAEKKYLMEHPEHKPWETREPV